MLVNNFCCLETVFISMFTQKFPDVKFASKESALCLMIHISCSDETKLNDSRSYFTNFMNINVSSFPFWIKFGRFSN